MPEFTSGTGRGRSPLRQGKSLDGECRPDSDSLGIAGPAGLMHSVFGVGPGESGGTTSREAQPPEAAFFSISELTIATIMPEPMLKSIATTNAVQTTSIFLGCMAWRA